MGVTYGYIRVSTQEQNESRQLLAMQGQGIAAERLFMDKLSGKDFQRPAWQTLLRTLAPGDCLCVTSIDRLGRNYAEIQEQWRVITKEKGVDVQVLDMPLLNTRRHKDLLGTFIADLVLQVLSFVAQSERENIRKRQREGIDAARARGQHLGRRSKRLPKNFEAVYAELRQGRITACAAAKALGMARSTFRYQVELREKAG